MRIVLDIETTRNVSKIWFAVTTDIDTGESVCHTSGETLGALLERCELVIGHNLIAFDAWHLQNLWGVTIPLSKMKDTLVLSYLYRPDLEGGHSLRNWGTILKFPKGDYDEFDNPDLQKLEDYCIQDTLLTAKLYQHLSSLMQRLKFSQQSIDLEHKVAYIVAEQQRTGWLVDEPSLFRLRAELTDQLKALEKELQDIFPPKEIVLKTKTKYEPFNPGSRKQIAERLMQRGWKPDKFTEKGSVTIDDDVLEKLDFVEAKALAKYFMLQKRLSQVEQWVKYVGDDGRIHGKIIPNGAVTGRMTHSSPNMAQVPAASSDVPYGYECRALFTVPPKHRLVGVDASGLELRMLAHYMDDSEYTKEVIEGDVHSKNQAAAGLESRPQAKTFIYAFLYGAGPAKIGSIAGGGSAKGQKLIDSFLANTPSLKNLKAKVDRIASKGSLPGLDGRRLHVRQPHKALNTLLQGAGAILMKQALVFLYDGLTKHSLRARIVGNIHDEFQIESHEEDAEQVGKLAVQSIEEAGKALGLRCPTTGEYKIGLTWADTH